MKTLISDRIVQLLDENDNVDFVARKMSQNYDRKKLKSGETSKLFLF